MSFFKKSFSSKAEQQKQQSKILLPFDSITVAGTKAIEKLNELRGGSDNTPIIMGSPSELDLLLENMEDSGESVESIIESSRAIGFPKWFEDRSVEDEGFYEIPHGNWPDNVLAEQGLSAHLDISTRKPLKEVVIGLIPTSSSEQVPAFLKIGGWNECPCPEEHVAIFKKWKNEYSAEVACITNDTIEFTVSRPPTTKEEALVLAEEQFVYCSDIVSQGVETIEGLAATLLDSKVWYFWWD